MARAVSLALLLTACASTPSAYSAHSAASLDAHAGPRPTIGRALTEEPPAPGASAEGWAGLAGPAATDPMAGHHHHHHPGMVMPPTSSTTGAGDAH